MKALVLCGGLPQVALINELKSRGIYTILADMNDQVLGRQYADQFYAVSVLDIQAVREVAQKENVDFILTACADQVLLVQAQVSEELGLPCYIDFQTAKAVSSKEIMKKVFIDNDIPTSKYVVMDNFDEDKIRGFEYPLIVKPVDSYSSRGVCKVFNKQDLEISFKHAVEISRTNTAIVEEFVDGEELTIDVYIEEGKPHILCMCNTDKIPGNDKFVICRTRYPGKVSKLLESKIQDIVSKIVKAFNLINSPMLVQLITDGENISVVEFCARTGGGEKFKLVKEVSNFDVIKALVDLTLGKKPHVEKFKLEKYIVNEFLYCTPGVFDHLLGFEQLKEENIIKEFYQLKSKGTVLNEAKCSGDRVAYFTIECDTKQELKEKYDYIDDVIRVVDCEGNDILRHDLLNNVIF